MGIIERLLLKRKSKLLLLILMCSVLWVFYLITESKLAEIETEEDLPIIENAQNNSDSNLSGDKGLINLNSYSEVIIWNN